jgi:uncharacterized protein (DUF1330 family)
MRDRLDRARLPVFLAASLPSPVHALNLVRFRDARSYRLYGLMLAPFALLHGARPLWAGVHVETLAGEDPPDELVIVSYPDAGSLVRIVDSPFYSWVNRWRERGTAELEFGLPERLSGNISLGQTGVFAAVRFNAHEQELGPVFDNIGRLASPALELAYASTCRAGFPPLLGSAPGDPVPLIRNHTVLMFVKDPARADERLRALVSELEPAVHDLSVDLLRSTGIRESLPN